MKGVSSEMEKIYIGMFSCVTRAIHLYLMTDLTATAFICAARRGTPAMVILHNAKTFKAPSKVLTKLSSDSSFVKKQNRVELQFGKGIFLRKVFGNARLKFDELLTILLEV